jgi:hypothetical protein
VLARACLQQPMLSCYITCTSRDQRCAGLCCAQAYQLRASTELLWSTLTCKVCAATLSQDGNELWTATEGSTSGSVSITGYKRCCSKERGQWQLTHSFAAITGLSRELQTSKIVLHLLPASRCIAVVLCSGLVYILCVEDSAAPRLRLSLVCQSSLCVVHASCSRRLQIASLAIPHTARCWSARKAANSEFAVQDGFSRPKSCTLVRTMRRDVDSAPVDMLTHVRLHVTRRVVALEHMAVAKGPRAAKGKVVVEVGLQRVWDACMARALGHPPDSLQVCAVVWPGPSPMHHAGAPLLCTAWPHCLAILPPCWLPHSQGLAMCDQSQQGIASDSWPIAAGHAMCGDCYHVASERVRSLGLLADACACRCGWHGTSTPAGQQACSLSTTCPVETVA